MIDNYINIADIIHTKYPNNTVILGNLPSFKNVPVSSNIIAKRLDYKIPNLIN